MVINSTNINKTMFLPFINYIGVFAPYLAGIKE
jgi:hypothetical protein